MRLKSKVSWPKVLTLFFATTFLGTTNSAKSEQDRPSFPMETIDKKIRKEIEKDYTQAGVPLASPVDSAQAFAKNALYIQLPDTCSLPVDEPAFNRYVDVDSLISKAEATHKSVITFDSRQEQYQWHPSSWNARASYYSFPLSALKEINNKAKQDAKTLKTPETKILFKFDATNNACNNTCQKDTFAARYPDNIVMTLNSAAFRYNDTRTLQAIDAHELGHFVTQNRFIQMRLILDCMTQNDSTTRMANGLTLLRAKRYWEHESDSISVVLMDNRDDLKNLFVNTEEVRTKFRNGLLQKITEGSIRLNIDMLNSSYQQSLACKTFRDNLICSHPSDVNRMRNMKLVMAYHQSRDSTERATLQSMMVKGPPLIDCRNLSPQPK